MNAFLDYLWLPGVVMSVIWGLRSGAIFRDDKNKHPCWEYFYQFTSNFFGSLAGWCCVYALAVRTSAAHDLRSLNAGDALLFLLALLGLTGHFTQALVGLVGAIEAIAAAVGKKLSG